MPHYYTLGDRHSGSRKNAVELPNQAEGGRMEYPLIEDRIGEYHPPQNCIRQIVPSNSPL